MLEIINTPVTSVSLPSEDIALRPAPTPEDKDWDTQLELIEDIARRGLNNLFTVREIAEGEYEVIDGSRRFSAIQYLYNENRLPEEYFPNGTINVQVRKNVDEAQAMADQIRGNYHVKKTISTHELRQIRRIAMLKQWPVEKVAEYIGCSPAYVKKKRKLVELPEAVQKAVDEGKISLTNADTLGKLPAHLMEEHLENAVIMPAADFADRVAQELAEWKKEKQGVTEKHAAEFNPEAVAKYMKANEASAILEQAKTAYELDPSDYNKGCLDTVNRIFRLDEESIAEARAEFEAKQAEKEARKEARKAEREKKKVEDAQKVVEAAGAVVSFE